MKNKLISIIIPCYNVEPYLPRCFKSLQKQTLGIEHMELIFVDDASTDHTWDTLKAIESAFPGSVLIIQNEQNQGLGYSRNLGLSYATCPYVAFLDSDDWVEPEMYQSMYEKMVQYQCDIVRCQYIRDYGVAPISPEEKCTGKQDRLLLIDSIAKRKGFLQTDSLGFTAWDKLIRKDFLTRHNILFAEGAAYEDHPWSSLLYLYAEHIYVLEQRFYHYFVNNSSIVLTKNQEYHHDFLIVGLMKWQEWVNRGFLKYYRNELECNFLLETYLGYIKVLFLRFSQIPYEHFLVLKQEVLARIPDYRKNPYISTAFTPVNQILLELLVTNVTREALDEIALSVKNVWQSVTIFTATHIPFSPPADDTYLPLHVGRASAEDLGYLGDDTGDNISLINCFYGELTGLYWIWKNYHSSDYAGLCHYRRYFLNDSHQIMSKMDYLRIFSSYDIIISKPVHSEKTYYECYKEAHNINDLLTVGEAIQKLYPEYYPYFEQVLESHFIYSGNLFAASKVLFNQYADWLFTILKASSQQIDTSTYDNYHRRVYGFLSEQLVYVWVKGRDLTYYECEVGFTQEKAETVNLKKALAQLIALGDISQAKLLFKDTVKDRPDVLLPGSDLSQELKTIYQILNVCEKERLRGHDSLLKYSRDLGKLITHYTRITEILYHMSAKQATPKDIQYLKYTLVSKPALQAIIDATPDYRSVDLNRYL